MLKMVSKSSLLFGFLIVAFFISSKVTARDLAETTDAHKEVKGVEDAKRGGYYPGYGGGGRQYGGGGGQYSGGEQYGGDDGGYGDNCNYGCCDPEGSPPGYGGCTTCCALNKKFKAKPNN